MPEPVVRCDTGEYFGKLKKFSDDIYVVVRLYTIDEDKSKSRQGNRRLLELRIKSLAGKG